MISNSPRTISWVPFRYKTFHLMDMYFMYSILSKLNEIHLRHTCEKRGKMLMSLTCSLNLPPTILTLSMFRWDLLELK